MGLVWHSVIDAEPESAGATGAALIVRVTAVLERLKQPVVAFDACA